MVYAPMPANCFLRSPRYRKEFKYGEERWVDQISGLIYTWDGEHGGEVEVFSKRGRHRGVVDAVTGEYVKDPVNGRRISV
ncbi:colicin E3/pyocin S6 family cytotoxin [Streptomyces sp. S465]|uniref:colicin E3/pyocin S6 family cytotoxin n=1 Tax=Streptomyces sp. S465 TaxID=2979468 RepID=UPI0022A8C6C0|nr:colicin E3/pyocin S6 family cytotoxin [Streptomyces sp. S465]WAP56812.1 colicin E3/pyocin S6 family cytotoxin [Streptomyces sp. S465]